MEENKQQTSLSSNNNDNNLDYDKHESLDFGNQKQVLEFLLKHALRGDVSHVADRILEECGSLSSALNFSYQALANIEGMTLNASLLLSSLPSVFKSYVMSGFDNKRKKLDRFDLFKYIQALFLNLREERIYLIALDKNNYLVNTIMLGEGLIDQCQLSQNKFVAACTNLTDEQVYIAHNHTVGSATPSQEDVEFTEWAKTALEAFDLKLADHIIVSKENLYSFEQDGYFDAAKFDKNNRLQHNKRQSN